ncbi:MAG: glucosaminidase domain-containing protein, partial [Pseudomonadales bacterium]|nr:glucosaminidase domain-containing protein [Pseudomonadales bacterium]
FEDMLDEKLSISMAEYRSIGIAKMLEQQLAPATHTPSYQFSMGARQQVADSVSPRAALFDSPESFVAGVRQAAVEVAGTVGISPRALIAQAALETGWGSQVMQSAGGTSTHNLFGIKAGDSWDGNRVAVESIEVINGIAGKVRSFFRSYDSLLDSFRDYGDFITSQERYQPVLAEGTDEQAFTTALGASGYATDPAYGQKLQRILQHPALQQLVTGEEVR